VRLAASAGLHLDDWQQEALFLGLSEDDEGKWATREVNLVVGRQNGKGSILEALELGGLFLFEDCRLIVHSAHEFATSSEHFLRIWSLIENTPDLLRKVKAVHRSHGQEGIELLDGSRLKFKTRTKGGGRGHSGDLVVWDEAMILGKGAVSATWPIMSARVNPQAWVTGSAPMVGEESAELRKYCKIGRAGDPDVTYIEYCADDGDDLDDPRVWAMCNPGYPHRLSERAVRNERRKMDDDDFARERLGIWHDPADDGNQLIPAERWNATETDDSELAGAVVFGLEVAEDRSWSSFGAAGRSSLGEFVHVEVVDYREGTAWVPARAKQLVDKWGGKVAVPSGSPAASLVKDMQKVGLRLSSPAEPSDDIVLLTVGEHAKACAQLYDGVIDDKVRHRVQPHLTVAVRGAVKRDVGDGAWTFSRRRSSVDVSPLNSVAVALAIFDPVIRRKPVFAY
jgi:phage terminase large subunit-like protein